MTLLSFSPSQDLNVKGDFLSQLLSKGIKEIMVRVAAAAELLSLTIDHMTEH